VGGGIEIWFAYVLALVFLLFRPQGLFGERSSTASDHHKNNKERTHVLPRKRPVQDQLPGDQQIFPIAQDRWPSCCCSAVAFLVVPLLASDYFFAPS
jgi:hypothetical protein